MHFTLFMVFNSITGAHMNPCISILLAIIRKGSTKLFLLWYVFASFLSLGASFLVLWLSGYISKQDGQSTYSNPLTIHMKIDFSMVFGEITGTMMIVVVYSWVRFCPYEL